MELGLATAGLALAIVALVCGVQARGGLRDVRRLLDQSRADLDQTRGELGELRTRLEAAQAELTRLQEAPAPPPLPRARHAGLDDLREQLRAAHRESAESPEE